MASIALLRGVNVGGNHKLPMKDFAALLEGLGCARVRTYIQSGNAAFEPPPSAGAKLPQAIQSAIQKKFGFEAPVVLRSAAQLSKVLRSNPFLARETEEEHLYVGFLAGSPAPALAGALDPKRSPGDSFALLGSEVYLHLPQGGARTKFTNAYFDATLKTVCTFRNWRTVRALHAMAKEAGA